jgi:hypothetical protein
MAVKRQIMRVLGAAIVLIALSFAPSVAEAHRGHDHHAAAPAHGPALHVHADGHVAHPKSVAHSNSEQAPPSASLRNATLGQAAAPASLDRNCVTGCCYSACAACCVAGLPGSVELAPLAPRMTRLALPPSRTGATREPDSLRRPPKHFT